MKEKYNVKNLWKRNQVMITALALMIAIAGYLSFTGKQIGDEIISSDAQFEDSAVANVQDGEDGIAAIYDISDEDLDNYMEIESLDSDYTAADQDFLDQDMAEALDGTDLTDDAMALVDDADADDVLETAASTEDQLNDGEIPGEAVFTSTTGISSLAGANLIKEQTRARNKETLLEIINNANVSESAKQQAVNSMITLTELAEKECSAEILLEAKGFDDVVVSISGETVDVLVGMKEISDIDRAQIVDIVKRKTGIGAENIIISPVGQ